MNTQEISFDAAVELAIEMIRSGEIIPTISKFSEEELCVQFLARVPVKEKLELKAVK